MTYTEEQRQEEIAKQAWIDEKCSNLQKDAFSFTQDLVNKNKKLDSISCFHVWIYRRLAELEFNQKYPNGILTF